MASGKELGLGVSIYVVDDEPMVAELVSALLEIEGLGSTVFQSPVRALDAFSTAKRRPQLLITDYLMSELNGMELIEQCLRLEPGLRTILVSGYVNEDQIAAATIKPDRFLSKPFKSDMLIATIRSLLGR